MKKIYLIIIALSAMVMVSCNEDKKSANSDESITEIAALSDTVKNHLIKQDSLYKELIDKVDSLTLRLNESQDDIIKLKQTIDDYEKPRQLGSTIALIALIISVITLILFIVGKVSGPNIEKINGIIGSYLDDSEENGRIRKINQRISNLESSKRDTEKDKDYAPKSSGNLQSLEGRLSKVEKCINDIAKIVPNISQGNVQNSNHQDEGKVNSQNIKNKQKEQRRIEYAKSNTDIYFLDIVDSNQEGCVYKLEYISDNEAEFDLISLDKLKSRNGWEKVVDYSGCLMDDAHQYKVKEKGICTKKDESTWVMKRKLNIILS